MFGIYDYELEKYMHLFTSIIEESDEKEDVIEVDFKVVDEENNEGGLLNE